MQFKEFHYIQKILFSILLKLVLYYPHPRGWIVTQKFVDVKKVIASQLLNYLFKTQILDGALKQPLEELGSLVQLSCGVTPFP